MKRKLALLLTLVISVLGTGLVVNSTAASASVWVSVDSPYVHTDILGRHWIYTNTYNQGCCMKNQVESTLYQYYGGAWHVVSDAYNTSTSASNSAKAIVYCGSPYTNYSFQARGRVWVYGPYGWSYQGETWSRVVVKGC